MGLIKTGIGFGLGYVLGARAGRQRYEQLLEEARRLGGHPKVQEAALKLPPGVRDGLSRVVGTPAPPAGSATPGVADPAPGETTIDLDAPLGGNPGNPPVVNPVVFESSNPTTRRDLQ